MARLTRWSAVHLHPLNVRFALSLKDPNSTIAVSIPAIQKELGSQTQNQLAVNILACFLDNQRKFVGIPSSDGLFDTKLGGSFHAFANFAGLWT